MDTRFSKFCVLVLMMDRQKIIEFFDVESVSWDENSNLNSDIIKIIFDDAKIIADVTVLDVACGTGVLIPEYLARGVKHITAIDFSSGMIEKAKEKFSLYDNVDFFCADALEYDFDRKFDRIVIYDAFPHFLYPEKLIKRLSSLLNDGGILTVAHGASREKIQSFHDLRASAVSSPLPSSDELASIFAKYLDVIVNISDDKMYQVSGTVK